MASAPDGSPPQSKDKDSSPPSPKSKYSGSPPPESSSKTPEKSPPPPKESSPPPSPPASSPPPSTTPTPPASPPPSTPKQSTPTPTPSKQTPTPSQPSISTTTTPAQPAPTNNKGNNQKNVPAAAATHTPQPPHLTPGITPATPHNNTSQHSPPPPRLHSPSSKSDSGSKSNSSSSQSLPIILGLSAGVVLLLVIILTIIIIACCRRKKKSKYGNHIHYHNYTPPPGDDGYAHVGYDANNYVNNLVSPPGGNVGHGGWPQTPSTPQTQGNTSYSTNMSANIHGQVFPSPPAYASPSPLGLNQISFTYEELSRATNGFSQANLLGQGGFGYVHKGVLPSGKEVAVKSLKSGSGQGEREFQAEVETISRVHHRHLVSLVGYSISGDKRMLAYEFLPNNTLEFHLHEQGPMDWPTRLKIALGAAKGLAYLHEDCHPRIIHRDIKSANILLDLTFESKVADFGLARLTQDNNTHVSTRVMGTFGYLAPEYASSGKLTDKSDVFSFGVVLLELITGRRPLDLKTNDQSLVDWARPLCAIATENGNFSALVDPRLENNFDHQEMARMVSCAAASIRHSARRRPKMRQVVRALEGDVPLDEINGLVAASQTSRFSSTNDTSENEPDSYSYTADMEKFRKLVMESQEYGSSSNYGNTSEYGLHPSSSSSNGSSGQIASKQQL